MCVPLQFRVALYTNEKSRSSLRSNEVVLAREQRATQHRHSYARHRESVILRKEPLGFKGD